jgi:hypothetical protein
MTIKSGFAILFTLLLGLHILPFPNHDIHAQNKSVAAPAFTLKLLDGGTLRSSELKGKIQVLKFVASY